MNNSFHRVWTACIVGGYLLTNVIGAHAIERSLWEERRTALKQAVRCVRLLPAANGKKTWDPPFKNSLSTASQPLSGVKHLALPFDVLSTVLPYGAVGDVREGKLGKPVVFLVQDIHGNKGAQKNIGGIVSQLTARGVTLTGVEGAWGPMDLSSFHPHPDPKSVSLVADALVDSGHLTGAEWAGLTASHPPLLVGVESPDLYHSNVAVARECVARRPSVDSYLHSLQNTLQAQKERFYSPELLTFDGHQKNYLEGREGLAEYSRYLSSLAGARTHAGAQVKLFLKAMDRESQLNLTKVESEWRTLMNQLANNLNQEELDGLMSHAVGFRRGEQTNSDFFGYVKTVCARTNVSLAAYPSFLAYIDYVDTVQSIQRGSLLNELVAWETALGTNLAKTSEERRLLALDRDAGLLHLLLKNEMSPDTWAHFCKRREAIVALPDRLKKFGDFQEPPGGLVAFFQPHETFCRLAMERDQTLSMNFMRQMETHNAAHSVLVAGGFHTPGLQAELQKHGYSSVVITPRIDKIEGKPLDVFARDPLPIDQMFAGRPISLSQELLLNDARKIGIFGYLVGVLRETIERASNSKVVRRVMNGNHNRLVIVGGSKGNVAPLDSKKVTSQQVLDLANGSRLLVYLERLSEAGTLWKSIKTIGHKLKAILLRILQAVVPSGHMVNGGNSFGERLINYLFPVRAISRQNIVPEVARTVEPNGIEIRPRRKAEHQYSVFDSRKVIATLSIHEVSGYLYVSDINWFRNTSSRPLFIELGRMASSQDLRLLVQVTTPDLYMAAESVMDVDILKITKYPPEGVTPRARKVGVIGTSNTQKKRISVGSNELDEIVVSDGDPSYVLGSLDSTLLGADNKPREDKTYDDANKRLRDMLDAFEKTWQDQGKRFNGYLPGTGLKMKVHGNEPIVIDMIVQADETEHQRWKDDFKKILLKKYVQVTELEISEESPSGFYFSLTDMDRRTVEIVGVIGEPPFWEQLQGLVLFWRGKKHTPEKSRWYQIARLYWGQESEEWSDESELRRIADSLGNDEKIALAAEFNRNYMLVEAELTFAGVLRLLTIERPPKLEYTSQGQEIQFVKSLSDIFRARPFHGAESYSIPPLGENHLGSVDVTANKRGQVEINVSNRNWIFNGLNSGVQYTLQFGHTIAGSPSVVAVSDSGEAVRYEIWGAVVEAQSVNLSPTERDQEDEFTEVEGETEGLNDAVDRSTEEEESDAPTPSSVDEPPSKEKKLLAAIIKKSFALDPDQPLEVFFNRLSSAERIVMRNGIPLGVTTPEFRLNVDPRIELSFEAGLGKFSETDLTLRCQWEKGIGLLIFFSDKVGETLVFSVANCPQSLEDGPTPSQPTSIDEVFLPWKRRPNPRKFVRPIFLGKAMTLSDAQNQTVLLALISRMIIQYGFILPAYLKEPVKNELLQEIGKLQERIPSSIPVPKSRYIPFVDPVTGIRFGMELVDWNGDEASLSLGYDNYSGLVVNFQNNGQSTVFDFESQWGSPRQGFRLSRPPQTPTVSIRANPQRAAYLSHFERVLQILLSAEKDFPDRKERLEELRTYFEQSKNGISMGAGELKVFFTKNNGERPVLRFIDLPIGEHIQIRFSEEPNRGAVIYFVGPTSTSVYSLRDALDQLDARKALPARKVLVEDSFEAAQASIRSNPAGLLLQALENDDFKTTVDAELNEFRGVLTLKDPISGIKWRLKGLFRKKVVGMSINSDARGVKIQLNVLSNETLSPGTIHYRISKGQFDESNRIRVLDGTVRSRGRARARETSLPLSNTHNGVFLLAVPIDPCLGFFALTILALCMVYKENLLKSLPDWTPQGLFDFISALPDLSKTWMAGRQYGETLVASFNNITDFSLRAMGRDVGPRLKNRESSGMLPPAITGDPFLVTQAEGSLVNRHEFPETMGGLLREAFEISGAVGVMVDPHRLVGEIRSPDRLSELLNSTGDSAWTIPEGLLDGLARGDPESILHMRLFSSHQWGRQALEQNIVSAATRGDTEQAALALAAWDASRFPAKPDPKIVSEALALLTSENHGDPESVVSSFALSYNRARSSLLLPQLASRLWEGSRKAPSASPGIVVNLSALFNKKASDVWKDQTWVALASALDSLERDPNTPLALVVFGENISREQVEKMVAMGLPSQATEILRSNLFVESDRNGNSYFNGGKFSLKTLQERPQWQRELKAYGFSEGEIIQSPAFSVQLIPLDVDLNLRRIIGLLRFINVAA